MSEQHQAPHAEQEDLSVRIPPLAFLKTCWLLFWNTIRHPFQTTVIDLATGSVIGRTDETSR